MLFFALGVGADPHAAPRGALRRAAARAAESVVVMPVDHRLGVGQQRAFPFFQQGGCPSQVTELAIYHIDPDNAYIPAAEKLVSEVLQKGYDHEFGGPYKDYNRITGEMLMWGNPDILKTCWAMEQAVTSGLQLYGITGDTLYLEMADESLDFFMKYFVDHEYGEVYMDRTRTGGFAWNENKGNEWKAAYHSIELGYYVYLYGNLFVKHEPVTLHYNFVHSPEDRNILLTPLAIDDSTLRIQKVLWEGQPYTNYDPNNRILELPAGAGGHFEMTYESIAAQVFTDNVTFKVAVPSSTPASDTIYIAGTFNYWDPGPGMLNSQAKRTGF